MNSTAVICGAAIVFFVMMLALLRRQAEALERLAPRPIKIKKPVTRAQIIAAAIVAGICVLAALVSFAPCP